jgi:hypothetical protein
LPISLSALMIWALVLCVEDVLGEVVVLVEGYPALPFSFSAASLAISRGGSTSSGMAHL